MTSSQASLLHRFACIICMENKQTSSASPAISPSCKHQSNVCKPCLQMHIRTALSTKFASSEPPLPKCLQCPSEITHEYVQKSFPTLASTYSDYLLQAYLLTIPDYRPCLQSGCSSGQFHSGREEQPIATCPKCSGKSCFTCRIPWHASRTCAEVKEEERVNEELFEKITKICPGCGIRVEKADGCDHMTCRCKTEWCWLCRASYGPIRTLGNEGHRRKCPHWRGPTGEMPVVPVVQVGILAPVQAAPVRSSRIEPTPPEVVIREAEEELERQKLGVPSVSQQTPRLCRVSASSL